MIKKFGFYSRVMAENIDPTIYCPTKSLLISINEPRSKDGLPQLLPGWDKIVTLQFHDIVRDHGPYTTLTDTDAKDIFEAIRDAAFDCEKEWVVVVHCRAGISRSAAVCRFIKHYTKHTHSPALDLYYHYNGLVYSKLCEQAGIPPVERPRKLKGSEADPDFHLYYRQDCTQYVTLLKPGMDGDIF